MGADWLHFGSSEHGRTGYESSPMGGPSPLTAAMMCSATLSELDLGGTLLTFTCNLPHCSQAGILNIQRRLPFMEMTTNCQDCCSARPKIDLTAKSRLYKIRKPTRWSAQAQSIPTHLHINVTLSIKFSWPVNCACEDLAFSHRCHNII